MKYFARKKEFKNQWTPKARTTIVTSVAIFCFLLLEFLIYASYQHIQSIPLFTTNYNANEFLAVFTGFGYAFAGIGMAIVFKARRSILKNPYESPGKKYVVVCIVAILCSVGLYIIVFSPILSRKDVRNWCLKNSIGQSYYVGSPSGEIISMSSPVISDSDGRNIQLMPTADSIPDGFYMEPGSFDWHGFDGEIYSVSYIKNPNLTEAASIWKDNGFPAPVTIDFRAEKIDRLGLVDHQIRYIGGGANTWLLTKAGDTMITIEAKGSTEEATRANLARLLGTMHANTATLQSLPYGRAVVSHAALKMPTTATVPQTFKIQSANLDQAGYEVVVVQSDCELEDCLTVQINETRLENFLEAQGALNIWKDTAPAEAKAEIIPFTYEKQPGDLFSMACDYKGNEGHRYSLIWNDRGLMPLTITSNCSTYVMPEQMVALLGTLQTSNLRKLSRFKKAP